MGADEIRKLWKKSVDAVGLLNKAVSPKQDVSKSTYLEYLFKTAALFYTLEVLSRKSVETGHFITQLCMLLR